MIYSINEGFLPKKPNKFALENPKAVEAVIKGFIKYMEDSIKLVNKMGALVSKSDYTDADDATMTAYLETWKQLDAKFGKDYERKARVSMIKLLKAYATKDYNEEDIPADASTEYKTLHKKICKNGEYIKTIMQHSRNLHKAADKYADLRKKYGDMNSIHTTACENYGGYIGWLIGSIPFYNPFKKLPEGMKEE